MVRVRSVLYTASNIDCYRGSTAGELSVHILNGARYSKKLADVGMQHEVK